MCEETLHDSFACRRFVGLTMDSKCPDETTILRFRHLLEKNGLDKQVFDLFKQQLTNRGLLFSKGTIVDGSFIEAPSSAKKAIIGTSEWRCTLVWTKPQESSTRW